MNSLSQAQLALLQDMLNQREKTLVADIQRETNLQDDFSQLASEVPDPGDSSFAHLSIDLGNAAVARDLTELRAIGGSRMRIENGSYGICTECGYEIPFERLQAQPVAERCAPCQQMYEKTHADSSRGATM